MKKLILLLIILYSFSFSQDWNSTVTTNISESTLEKMDLFTNKDGNHILLKRSNGNIIYYNVNSLGTVTISSTTLESSGDFPAITGSNDIIYAFYRTGDYIEMQYSTNGGINWVNNSELYVDMGSNECNGIEAVHQDQLGVHLVWAAMDSDPYFETYYFNLKPNYEWDYYKNVTDYAGFQYGGRPTVTFSSDRVHVSFKSGIVGELSTRDRLNGSWQTPQPASGSDYSSVEKLIASGDYLYMIYSQFVPPSYFDLAYKSRSLSGTWSSGSGTDIETDIIGTEYTFDICKTYDNKLQLVYELNDGQYQDLLHRNYDGSWSDPAFEVDNNQSFAGNPKGISCTSNDFFVIWKRQSSNSLFYRQYDDYPLAPQNLSVQAYWDPELAQNFPKLTWAFNNDPDVYITNSAYQIWRRVRFNGGAWSDWSQIGSRNGNINEYVDYEISGLYAEAHTAEYKIRAKDYTDHISSYSSTVSINFSIMYKVSRNHQNFVYELSQNYPNPFNPTTTIDYSIGSPGLATLKVYDMLGTEVASLVNENKEAGSYSVEFNASNLPSGIYFYTLISGNFMETKKLILLK